MGSILKTVALLIMPPFYLIVYAFAAHHRYQEYGLYGGVGLAMLILVGTWVGIRKCTGPWAKGLLAGMTVVWCLATIVAFLSLGALLLHWLAVSALVMTMHLWMLSQAWSKDPKLRVLMPLLVGITVAVVTVGVSARYVVGHVVQVRQQIVRQLPYEIVPVRAGEDPNCQEIRFYFTPPEITRDRELYIYASVGSASIAQWLQNRKPAEASLVFDLVFNFDEVFNGEIVQIDDRELRSLSHCMSSLMREEDYRRGTRQKIPEPYHRLDAGRWYLPLFAPIGLGFVVIAWQALAWLRSRKSLD